MKKVRVVAPNAASSNPRRIRSSATLKPIAAALLLVGLHAPAWAALDVAVQANPAPVLPGEVVGVTFIVTNSDGFSRQNVVMRMGYPAGLAALSHGLIQGGACDNSVSNNSRCDVTEQVIWNLGTIPAGTGVTVSMPPTVAAATLPGTVIEFAASVTDSAGGTAGANETVEVVNSRVLQLGLSETTQEPVQPGTDMTYQLSFGHTASSAVATNAVLSLPVPAGTTFVSASDGGTLVGDTVQWTLGTLLPGQVGERRVTLMVNGSVTEGSVLKAEANLSADGGKLVKIDALTRVEAATGLALALDVNANPAAPNETLDAKLTVTNNSFFDRSGVVARMRYPVGLAALSHGLIQGGACDNSVSNNSRCDVTEQVIWNLGTIPAGTGVTVSMPPTVAAATLPGTVIEFAASVTDSAGGTAGANETVEVVNSRVLQLGLSETTQEPVQPGTDMTYQLSFGHTASSAVATNAVLSLPVPAGTTFVSASDGGTLVGDTVQWTLGTLLPGQVGERRVTLMVNGSVTEGLVLKAEANLSADGGKLVKIDALTRVEAATGLALALDVNANPAAPNETLDAKLTVTNNSFFDRSGVVARMRYPVGLAALSHGLIQGGACDNSVSNNSRCDVTEQVIWNLGTIPAGTGVTVSMPPTVAAATLPGTVIEFAASVTDSAGGTAGANETVEVVNSRVLQLGLSETTQEPVQPGTDMTYQLSFGHTASSAVATNAVLSLPVPAGTTFVSASDGGTLVGDTVQWTLGNLNPGQVGKRDVVLHLDPLATLETSRVLKLEAELRDASGQLARVDDTSHVEASSPLRLSVSVSPNPGTAGSPETVSLSVHNASAFDRSSVVLRMRYPVGLAALSHGSIQGGACDNSVSNNNQCDVTEQVIWNLGTLPANATVTQTFSPTLLATLTKGSLLEFVAEVQDATARSRDTRVLRVGNEVVDSDGDGVINSADNCINAANADQRDTNGDGYGNLCDADLDNNGVVNTLDLGKLKADFGKTGAGLDADLDGNGVVNTLDLGKFKALFGKVPGPSGVAP